MDKSGGILVALSIYKFPTDPHNWGWSRLSDLSQETGLSVSELLYHCSSLSKEPANRITLWISGRPVLVWAEKALGEIVILAQNLASLQGIPYSVWEYSDGQSVFVLPTGILESSLAPNQWVQDVLAVFIAGMDPRQGQILKITSATKEFVCVVPTQPES
jgi:hypothetical protein